jgi:hypothetical protein
MTPNELVQVRADVAKLWPRTRRKSGLRERWIAAVDNFGELYPSSRLPEPQRQTRAVRRARDEAWQGWLLAVEGLSQALEAQGYVVERRGEGRIVVGRHTPARSTEVVYRSGPRWRNRRDR